MKKITLPQTLEWIQSVSRDIVQKEFPEELEFFSAVWKVMEEYIAKWRYKIPEEWQFEECEKRLKKDLGFLDESEISEINTPKVIALISLVWLRLTKYEGHIQDANIEETIAKYGKSLPEWLKLKTIKLAVPMIKGDLIKIGRIPEAEAEEEKKYVMYSHDHKDGEPITESKYQALIKMNKDDYLIWMDEINDEINIYEDEFGTKIDPIQKKLLKMLIKKADQIVTYQELFEAISSIAQDSDKYSGWHDSYRSYVYGWVSELRKNTDYKLSDILLTVPNKGYKLTTKKNREKILFCLIDDKKSL